MYAVTSVVTGAVLVSVMRLRRLRRGRRRSLLLLLMLLLAGGENWLWYTTGHYLSLYFTLFSWLRDLTFQNIVRSFADGATDAAYGPSKHHQTGQL